MVIMYNENNEKGLNTDFFFEAFSQWVLQSQKINRIKIRDNHNLVNLDLKRTRDENNDAAGICLAESQ